MSTCALTACSRSPRYRVKFWTGDVYLYCGWHGKPFARRERGTRQIAEVNQVSR